MAAGKSCSARLVLLWMATVFACPALAAPQRLDCVLTDTDAASGIERRPIVILFDEDAASMRLQEGGRTRDLGNVSISMVSMSGGDANTTVGVSKSSWRVVLQTYEHGSVRTEFGVCSRRAAPPNGIQSHD